MARNTRQRILDHALNVVNERGLEALGMRDIARDLGLSPGNVSYHFKKREDLIRALSAPLGAANRAKLATESQTVPQALEVFREIFGNQYRYRGLILSLPHLLEAFPEFREWYGDNQLERNADLLQLLERLQASGELSASHADLVRLQMHMSFVARFWMSEAQVSFPDRDLDAVIGHYLALLADLFRPYAPHREAELQPYLDGLLMANGPVKA